MKKKILIVQNYPSPYRIQLFNILNKRYDITLLYLQDIPKKRKWDSVVKDIQYEFFFCENKEYNLFGRTLYLSNFDEIKTKKFDVILLNTNLPDFLSMMHLKLFALSKKIPQFIWVTTWDGYGFKTTSYIRDKAISLIIHLMHKLLFSRCQEAIGYCKKSESLSLRYGLNCSSSSQYYPLEENYGKQQKKVNYSQEKVRLLTIAYIDQRKDLEKAILALNAVEGVKLTLAGSGDEKYIEYLQSLVNDDNKVEFIGHVDAQMKKVLSEQHDFLLFTTNRDSWGFVVNEAFYLGLPVIGSREAMSVLDLIVDDNNGYQFSSTEELISIFEKLKKMKKEKYFNLSLNAQKTIRGFNDKVLSHFYKLLK